MRISIYIPPYNNTTLTTPIHCNHTHRFHPLAGHTHLLLTTPTSHTHRFHPLSKIVIHTSVDPYCTGWNLYLDSLLRCIGRYLAQLDGLKSYFLSCGKAETTKVKSILEWLEHPLMKPLLLFLSCILPSTDRFNRLFQKSTENTAGNVS